MPSIFPAWAASLSVFGVTPSTFAALLRLSHGSMLSGCGRKTGILWCDRSAVTRSRVQRLPCPVTRPFRLRMPAIKIIIGNEHQVPDGRDDIGGGTVALAAAALRQAPFGMHPTDPMDQKHDLGCLIIDIGDHLVDESAHDTLLAAGHPLSAPTRQPEGLHRAR